MIGTSSSSTVVISGAIFTLIKSCAFTWKFGKGWCFPGSTAVWMFNVCMSSTFHLKPVQLLAKLQMDLMVEVTTLPKFIPISFTTHVDGLHGRPECALGRHVDLIRLKLIGQFHQTFSMCQLGEVPSIVESKTHHIGTKAFSLFAQKSSAAVDFPNELLSWVRLASSFIGKLGCFLGGFNQLTLNP